MRVEPFTVGSFLHVVKRGARGMNITGSADDKDRLLRVLFYMNDKHLSHDWEEEIENLAPYTCPPQWSEREPLVKVLAYTIMPNHLHLILKEIIKGGVSTYMRKVGQSVTNHFNVKYNQSGSVFQGSYRSKTIDSDEYLRYVTAYVMVKNVFELYPKGGLRNATKHFNDAWEWALTYAFSSFRDYATMSSHPLLDKDILEDIFQDSRHFKQFTREVIEGGK